MEQKQTRSLEENIIGILDELNPNWFKEADYKDTPKRVARMYEWFFRNEDPSEHFKKIFPTDNDEMVIVKDIKCFGLCPHHLLPIEYVISVGYIPKKWALGLSKIVRIVIACASYPKLQENLTTEIGKLFNKYLSPHGVMIVIKGLHGCMKSRGVEKDSWTVTSYCSGFMRKKSEARQEYLNLIKS